MSGLITPNLNGLTERQFKRKGQMNVTHDELVEQLQQLAQAMLAAFGPIAELQIELMARQKLMEDAMRDGTPLAPFATPEATVTPSESPDSRENTAAVPDAHDSNAPAITYLTHLADGGHD